MGEVVYTLHGPNVQHECCDCGDVCYGIPEALNPRCEKCMHLHYGVPRPVDRIGLYEGKRGTKRVHHPGDITSTVSIEHRREEVFDLPELVALGSNRGWRAGSLAEMPKGAQQLVAAASTWGWRAYVITGESWCTWLKRKNARALAYWIMKGGKQAFDCAVLYGDAPLRTIGINDLKRYVRENANG